MAEAKNLDDLFKQMNKEFKKELAIKGIGELKIKRIPFTSPRLNYETYGGIPRGRISMFAGKESSGKSTTALDIVKNAQTLFTKEWTDEVNELQARIAELEAIAADKDTSKSKRDNAKKETPELFCNLCFWPLVDISISLS